MSLGVIRSFWNWENWKVNCTLELASLFLEKNANAQWCLWNHLHKYHCFNKIPPLSLLHTHHSTLTSKSFFMLRTNLISSYLSMSHVKCLSKNNYHPAKFLMCMCTHACTHTHTYHTCRDGMNESGDTCYIL